MWSEVIKLNRDFKTNPVPTAISSEIKKLWLDKITYEDKEIPNCGSNNFAILWASFCNSDYIHGLLSVERHEIILTHVVLRPSSPPLSGYWNMPTLDIDRWRAEHVYTHNYMPNSPLIFEKVSVPLRRYGRYLNCVVSNNYCALFVPCHLKKGIQSGRRIVGKVHILWCFCFVLIASVHKSANF